MWGFLFGVAGPQSQSSSANPSLLGAWAKKGGGGGGGAADQKDQSPLNVRIKTQLLLWPYSRIMHGLPFLRAVVIGICFDGIKFCPCAKLGPRVWRVRRG